MKLDTIALLRVLDAELAPVLAAETAAIATFNSNPTSSALDAVVAAREAVTKAREAAGKKLNLCK